MRTLIILVVGLLAIGCGKPVKELTPEEKRALRDSVVGEYEMKDENGYTIKEVFVDNGIQEDYINNEKQGESKWAIVGGKIHIVHGNKMVMVYRINPDNRITRIGYIDEDGRRTDYLKQYQDSYTFKKIK